VTSGRLGDLRKMNSLCHVSLRPFKWQPPTARPDTRTGPAMVLAGPVGSVRRKRQTTMWSRSGAPVVPLPENSMVLLLPALSLTVTVAVPMTL